MLLITREEFKEILTLVQQQTDLQKSYRSREKLSHYYHTALLRIQVLEERNKRLNDYINADPEIRQQQTNQQFMQLMKIYM